MSEEVTKEHGLAPTPEMIAADNSNTSADDQLAEQPNAPAVDEPSDVPELAGADSQDGRYRPEGLADEQFGETNEETIDKLLKENKGWREKAGRKLTPPENLEEYTFELSKEVSDAVTIAADDPVMKILREDAKENGDSVDDFKRYGRLVERMVDAGIIEKPFDQSQLFEELAPEGMKGSKADIEARGAQRISTVDNWVRQLPEAGPNSLNTQQKEELRILTTSKIGVEVLEKLMRSGMNSSVQPGGGAAQSPAVTKELLEKRSADPRNDSQNREKYEPAFAAETDRMFKEFYS